ncbi:RNA polymerase sigma factor [Virgibacillus oceani]|uniref:RNA polymerase subunit sigma-24 n=1 Tax=Virgibacillus oceani TaxID=1479511 RepID=A0A917HA45_9BACI|nr:sigma-70 family RNA polymerase sigma factor [Virgibacillus oceani]GGG72405.1 hypothetical protein GCM10011398_15970 [Virgibacillus oceani]
MTNTEKSNLEDDQLPSIEEICNATWESIYRFIYFKVQNREEAEDITQETYIKAISHLQSGKVNPNKYIGFLKTVALNVMRDLWRKKKRRGTSVNIDLIDQTDTAAEDPAETSAQRHLIESALNKLNKEQRTVIELRILKGYSVAETAKLMNKKDVAIRVMQHRALRLLADILEINN